MTRPNHVLKRTGGTALVWCSVAQWQVGGDTAPAAEFRR